MKEPKGNGVLFFIVQSKSLSLLFQNGFYPLFQSVVCVCVCVVKNTQYDLKVYTAIRVGKIDSNL